MKNVKLRSMKQRSVITALSGALVMGFGANAMADSTDDLVNALITKGVLTEEEGAQLMHSRDTEKASKRSEIKASFKDGVIFESADKSTSFAVGGRIHADYRNFDRNISSKSTTNTNAGNESDTFDIRRARIELKGKFYDAYEFLVSTDLAGTSAGNTTSVLDQAWLNINWWKEAQFRFGQFKAPMNLEKMTSSNFIDFQERSLANQLAPNEDRGAMIWGIPKDGITYALAVTNGEGAKNRNDADPRVDKVEFVGRGTVNFAEIMGNKEAVYHIGAAASYTELAKSNSAGGNGLFSGTNAIRTEPRGINFLTLPVFTSVANVDNSIQRTRYGVEAAVAQGPFKLQAEWLRNKFEGDVTTTRSFNNDIDAWYVEALWLITGENYASAYKEGAFGNIKPKNDFVHPGAIGSGAYGAWEIGLRYSKLDAKDFKNLATATGAASAGLTSTISLANSTLAADTWTAGVKWILNPNTRILLNYAETKFDTPIQLGSPTNLENKERVVTARAQWNF
jgi:phosphate-selective porin OprO/OprP